MSTKVSGTDGIELPGSPGMQKFFYGRENLVGAVSNSGGFPSGGVIESGINANGRYTKWADGTMKCWGFNEWNLSITKTYSGGYMSNDAIITFPAAFVWTPVVVGATGNSFGVQTYGPALTTCAVIFTAPTQQTAVIKKAIAWMAVGCWYGE